MNSIAPIDAEREDLSTHVDLCAQRYKELDNRLEKLENKMDHIDNKLDSYKSTIITTCIATAGSIIVAVVGLVGVILSRMPPH